jgi:hypothetical protein
VSKVPPDLRRLVAGRAAGRCEYCCLPDTLQVGGFEVDHIVPRSAGGTTVQQNLAWACPHCNAAKWAHAVSRDSVTGDIVRLFNPRIDTWTEHFAWKIAPAYELEGQSSIGRATIERLQLNHPDLLTIRRILEELGIGWRLS